MTILRNVELCNEGKCMRVRMGDERHEKHGFTNNYLKKLEKIRTGVTIVFILLMSLIVFFHIGPDLGLDDNDKWTITIAIFAALASILIAVTNLTIKNKQLQTSSLFKVFELLASPDIRKSRRLSMTNIMILKVSKKNSARRRFRRMQMLFYILWIKFQQLY